jgi:hypothetical protein
MMIPLASMFNPVKENSKRILIAYTIGLALLGVYAMVMHVTTGEMGIAGTIYFFGVIAYQWIANALIIR